MNKPYSLDFLFGKKFNIPAYQRGYRWGEQEVTELLDDLWDFQKSAEKGEFYCLQPIVLKKRKGFTDEYDLIDGQQRLTTLYLILVFLEEKRFDEGYNQELFQLKYTSREDCEKFLEEKRFKNGIDTSNIDYSHICEAYQYIAEWFSIHQGAKGKITGILMDKDDGSNRNVKIIWYEMSEDENPIKAFIRLNVGKIPLTDAELIKALLLQSDKYTAKNKDLIRKRLYEIGSEWDQLEYSLQKEDLWYFLNNQENQNPTHIELIFDLIADKRLKEVEFTGKRNIKYATFLILNLYLQQLISKGRGDENERRIEAVDTFWNEVTEYYGHFNDWYSQRDLYHYVGYLINVHGRSEIDHLIGKSQIKSKSAFTDYLMSRIYDHVNVKKFRKNNSGKDVFVKFENLCYESPDGGNDKSEIHNLLLLHNVITTLNSDKELARFPFNLYKKTKNKQKWSLEHIYPQRIEEITNTQNQRAWLEDHAKSLSTLNDTKLKTIVSGLEKLSKADQILQDDFNKMYEAVYDIYRLRSDIKPQAIQKIGNLCLIDTKTNSSLNNSVFDVKREKIKNHVVDGRYIPICSRNAFLKAYTEYPRNNAFWTNEDIQSYILNLKSTLKDFLQPEWKN